MLTGTVFDIREFTVHDGPGIRTTVFMKGCRMRCSWCHNPEGLSPFPQVMKGSAGERVVGLTFTSRELATRLNRQAALLKIAEGGITFSGGEPLMQSAFVAELIDQLDDLHVTLDTCGNAPPEEFMHVVGRCRLVLLDLKLADPQEHRRWTGCDNRLILHNLGLLAATDIPFIIRVPLIPGVTDTDQNVLGIARILAALPRRPRVELLPYNRGARGKYAACGMELAAELTRLGLGFPQFSNDDVVVPGLVAAGYDIEDARDYSVAACWEFIIPGRGMEVVNIGAASMPSAVDIAIREGLTVGDSFEGILNRVQFHLVEQVKNLAARSRKLFLPPAPYYSVLMDGCLETGRDLSAGLKYNNFGIHGAASANAADALAAVKEFVFDRKSVEPLRLLRALKDNFSNDEELGLRLREKAPKVGNNDDRADQWLVALFDMFARACEAAGENGRGGRYRPGSGSAMYYVWRARGHEGMQEPVVGATADGRKSGEFFSSSLAPSPDILVQGPLSVLQSFGKIDYRRICNGGPLTLELSDGLFSGKDSLRKVGLFVRVFVESGCQQMQLNTLNVETLRDAQLHPERHKNLVVRVWGWSGYFCELDETYQNQIIGRHVYGL